VLPEENDDAISAFVARATGFEPVPSEAVLERAGLPHLADVIPRTQHGLQMTPRLTGTDGFYVAVLTKGA
jgi:16S rRNA (cytosine967-C5)-methyltransferase